jgi:hypothetical protein
MQLSPKAIPTPAFAPTRQLRPTETTCLPPPEVSVDGADLFNSAGCIPIQTIKDLPVLTLRDGQEFCDRDGSLLARVERFNQDGGFRMNRPGVEPCPADD